MDKDWTTHELTYKDKYDEKQTKAEPFTFASFAFSEGRFAKHFKKEKYDETAEEYLPLDQYIEMSEEEREGLKPYILAVDETDHLIRVLPSKRIILSTEERRDYWRLLKSFVSSETTPEEKSETPVAEVTAIENETDKTVTTGEWTPVSVDEAKCTACDKCYKNLKKVFAAKPDGKAKVIDPKGSSFSEIVKAAENCAAEAILPGTPHDPKEKNLEKLTARAAKFQ